MAVEQWCPPKAVRRVACVAQGALLPPLPPVRAAPPAQGDQDTDTDSSDSSDADSDEDMPDARDEDGPAGPAGPAALGSSKGPPLPSTAAKGKSKHPGISEL